MILYSKYVELFLKRWMFPSVELPSLSTIRYAAYLDTVLMISQNISLGVDVDDSFTARAAASLAASGQLTVIITKENVLTGVLH